jgi:hypothetical protein
LTDSEVKKKVLPSLVAICEDRGGGTRPRGWSASQHASEAPRKRHRKSEVDLKAPEIDAPARATPPARDRDRRALASVARTPYLVR